MAVAIVSKSASVSTSRHASECYIFPERHGRFLLQAPVEMSASWRRDHGSLEQILRQQNIIMHAQLNMSIQQSGLVAKAQSVLADSKTEHARSEPHWVAQPAMADKMQCLRNTFRNGTAAVEFGMYSRAGEDGIIDAIFSCVGHHDKCAVGHARKAHVCQARTRNPHLHSHCCECPSEL